MTPNPIADAVWSRALAHRTRTAVTTREGRLSYLQLVERAEVLAQRELRGRSPGPGRALVRSRSPLEVLTFVLGCWRAGCSAVVLHETAPDSSVATVARRVGAFATLVDGRWSRCKGPAERRAPDPREALVLTTSGTSGPPKLVALPVESVQLNARAIAAALDVDERTRLLVAQPLSRAYGLVGACAVGLLNGAELCLEPSSTPPPVLQRAIREGELALVQGAPAFFQLFSRYWSGRPFPSVRCWTTGGEVPSSRLLAGLRTAFPAARGHVIFGMTELGPRISHVAAEDPRVPLGYLGRPFDHVAWEVQTGADERSPGRLRLGGAALFLGYVGADGSYGGIDSDGFFTSPDLVSLDAGDGGLFHRGRHDQLFKVGGYLVNPALVEQTLLELPGVRDARCFGEPDPILGHAVAAEIVREAGGPGEKAILVACRSALDAPAVPRRVRFVRNTLRSGIAHKRMRSPTPRTPSGGAR